VRNPVSSFAFKFHLHRYVVGGDGTLAEVFNGLMSRPDAIAESAASFPIGGGLFHKSNLVATHSA
jgi:hypothetical protein